MTESGAFPAIVVAAFNRPAALSRLLKSLAAAQYPAGTVPLHISIDGGGNPRVAAHAAAFDWPHGPKIVDQQPTQLGLRAHILQCGELSARYGAIILLEDDLLVASAYYTYAVAALAHYAEQPAIGGISLYKYAIAESCFLPFSPLEEQEDTWFMQMPASWGQAWTAAQWRSFRAWLARREPELRLQQLYTILPGYMHGWGSQSWKKWFAAYLIETGRFFVYPQVSLSTNFGDPGTHADTVGLFQVSMLTGEKDWQFAELAESNSVYDVYFELLPSRLKRLCPGLAAYDLALDLYGQRVIGADSPPYLLTTRSGGLAERSYALDLSPAVQNVIHGVKGNGLRLVRTAEVKVEAVPPEEHTLRAGGAQLGAVMDRLPRFSVVVAWNGTAAEHRDAIASVLEGQEYPHREVIVVMAGQVPADFPQAWLDEGRLRLAMVPEGTDLSGLREAGLAMARGNFLCCLPAYTALAPGSLAEMGEALYRFPDVHWLVSLPENADENDMQAVAAQRWKADRARRATAATLLDALSPERVVFRRFLWEQDRSGEPLELWRNFFAQAAPHLVARNWSLRQAGFRPSADDLGLTWEGGRPSGSWAARLTGPFYRNNVRILRQVHLWMADYPPVIRYSTPDGNWYTSEF